MKLLFCEKCQDVIKLDYEKRSCKCGLVVGQYDENGSTSWNNGKGVSLAIGNGSLSQAIDDMRNHNDVMMGKVSRQDFYMNDQGSIDYAWVRPNDGPGNPHSRVEQ